MYNFIYKIIRRIYHYFKFKIDKLLTLHVFLGNGVKFSTFSTKGVPFIDVKYKSKCIIGKRFKMNNGLKYNSIGCPQRCTFFVGENVSIIIGNDVGISHATLVAYDNITIMDNVKIGGGVYLYTSDFHSLNPKLRMTSNDEKYKVNSPILVKKNAFIGAHSIILKGVIIGENSIIGAGSVVTKSVPDNEIWAGNPAKYIKNVTLKNKDYDII